MGTSPRSVSEGFMYVLLLAQRMESVIKLKKVLIAKVVGL